MKGSSASWMKFTWLGFIGNAFPFFLITWGMHFVTSGVAGLLMGAIPLFVVVLAHFSLPGERLTVPKAVGFVLGFCGIVVLIGPEAIFTFSMSGDELMGELAVLLGCLCYAIHGVSAKRLGVEHPAKQSAAVCLTGALMGLAFAGAGQSGWPSAVCQSRPLRRWPGLGLLPTAFATLLVYRLMARTGPSFVSLSELSGARLCAGPRRACAGRAAGLEYRRCPWRSFWPGSPSAGSRPHGEGSHDMKRLTRSQPPCSSPSRHLPLRSARSARSRQRSAHQWKG